MSAIDVDASPTSIRLASGKLIDLLRPRPEDIALSDIAASLSRQERFTGHCPLHPNVAVHSLAVEWIAGELLRGPEYECELATWGPDCDEPRLERAVRRAALMHDGTEAYCSDVSAPAKRAMREISGYGADDASDFDVLEAGFAGVIAEALHCAVPRGFASVIHQADVLAYEYESGYKGWGTARAPAWIAGSPYVQRCYRIGTHTLTADEAAGAFLARAAFLGIK